MDSKLLSALLTGVNRAFPYANAHAAATQDSEHDSLYDEQADLLFQVRVHGCSILIESRCFNGELLSL